MTAAEQLPAQNAGSTIYNPFLLPFYDWWVLWLANKYAWHCPTADVLLPLFAATLSERHLEIGVGSGYYPSTAMRSEACACKDITLVDLNPNTLTMAAGRIAASRSSVKVRTVVADAAEPLPLETGGKFSSVTLFHLLHCMPGPPQRKTKVFNVVREHLAEDGVLVGTTILAEERPLNWLATRLMKLYNGNGIFDNWKDTAGVFEAGLRRNFEQVDAQVIGNVMVFTARKPRPTRA